MKGMRCIDLPDADSVCGGRGDVILSDAVKQFLRDEVEKVRLSEPEWAITTSHILKQRKIIVRDTTGDNK